MPETAGFYNGETPIVKTNYKSGERIKLAFVFNPVDAGDDSNLVFIINNGILERAASIGSPISPDDTGNIVIGGTDSSIRIYMIRAYRQKLTPKQCLDNYMFDNPSNIELLSRNDVYGILGNITKDKMSEKQDIITIEGNLDDLLNNGERKENSTVTIERISATDSSSNFRIVDCRIRNHGQSTLSYPITSMKVWFNKSNKFNDQHVEQLP